jgi:phenylalanyl-tRNA synthetase alpha chain
VELLPCGLVHPNVLRSGGINPDEYGGFAFGLGLTRLVMMRYLIDDIRWLQSGDLRFLKQF